MKILFYPREKCKYGMVLITDDVNLAEIFRKRYSCNELNCEEYELPVTSKGFGDYFLKVQEVLHKKTAAFCYNSGVKKVFFIDPEVKTVQIVDFSVFQEFSPIQLLENLLYITLIPQEGILALHGAAVAKNGKAYLLLASTTCGKSTLTAFLWQKAGFEYITDDEIFISYKNRSLLPIRKNLSLRQGGYDFLNIEFEEGHHIFDGKAHTHLIVPRAELQFSEYEIEKIIFLAGYGSDEPYFVKMEPRQAFSQLLKGQLSGKNSEGNVAEKYRILTELAQNSYEMRYSDLWMAEKYLEHSPK